MPAAVVTYAVTRTMVGIIRQTIVQLCHAVGGEIANQHAVGDFDATRLLVVSTGRLAAGAAGLLGGFVVVAARPLLHRWTSGAVIDDPWLVGVFVATIIATAPAQVAYITFLYTNKPTALVASNLVQAVGTVVLCVLLIARWSAVGAALATGLAEGLAVGIYLPYLLCREISLPVLSYLGRCAVVAVTAFVLSLAVAQGCVALMPDETATQLGAIGLIWAALVTGPAFFLLFSAPMRATLRGKLFQG
jgi:O-antigen/teichoic acid export membrane protein